MLDRSVNGDPRSPGTSDLIRTPIAVITDSKISQQPFDPRSPSAGTGILDVSQGLIRLENGCPHI